jgi:hypothetical protein
MALLETKSVPQGSLSTTLDETMERLSVQTRLLALGFVPGDVKKSQPRGRR